MTIPYTKNGVPYRDYMRYTGLRILLTVKGQGKTFSVPAFILQISSLLALLTVAVNISDLIMLNFPWIKEEHRKLYFLNKCQNTEDYTSLQEKINLIE